MALVVLLLAVVFGSQGDWDEIAPIAGVFALVGVGLYVLFLLVMGLVFGNRLRTRDYARSRRWCGTKAT